VMRVVNAVKAAVVLSLILLTGAPVLAFDDASTVRVTRVDGAVTLDGAPLKEGAIITRDGKVEAPANAAAVLTWSNGSVVELYPGSSLVLRGVIFEADRKLEKSLLTLEKGRVFVKAQIPEHLFAHFEISAGNTPLMSQGAEFALSYNEKGKELTVLSLLGVVVTDLGGKKVRINEGEQLVHALAGAAGSPTPLPAKTKEALQKTSQRLGGSLLVDEALGSSGGSLVAKIGGVRNRRGNAPYTVKFKALTGGGSGRLKSTNWQFGGGAGADGREAEYTFTQGVYVVVLTVEDENGQKASAQMNISVEQDCGC